MMTEAEKQMLLDIRRELNEMKRESTRLRKGVVTEVGPVLKVQLGGECGGTEVTVVANGPVEEGDVVTILEGGGGAVVTGMAQAGGQAILDPGPGIVINGKNVAVDSTVARKDVDGHVLAVAYPVDADHGASKYYVDLLIALTLGVIPEVVSLPASPINGQTVVYNGWVLRYDSTPPDSRWPWQAVGGTPRIEVSGGDPTTFTVQNAGSNYAAPNGTALSVTLPAGIWGQFDVRIGAKYQYMSQGKILFHSYAVGSTNPNDDWAVAGSCPDGEGWDQIATTSLESRVTVPDPGAGSAQIIERVRHQGSGLSNGMTQRTLRVMPVWIGT